MSENKIMMEYKKNEMFGINTIRIICFLVNGAGLAMTTMDIIKLYNGEPANFLGSVFTLLLK
jgi:succinyl-CoA synthetase beta subunit